jgi:hypothetical protein
MCFTPPLLLSEWLTEAGHLMLPGLMASLPAKRKCALLDRLAEDQPLVTVELRPPRTGLSAADTMDVWIDMYHAVERLARRDTTLSGRRRRRTSPI